MNNWMKRRIERSRARCHRTLLAHKRADRSNKSKVETEKRSAAPSTRARLIL